jgi:hypothetical protein
MPVQVVLDCGISWVWQSPSFACNYVKMAEAPNPRRLITVVTG